jgi:hypothetical protein
MAVSDACRKLTTRMLLDVLGHPGDNLGYLIALKYMSVQVCIGGTSQDMEKGGNTTRDRLIYWDIPEYPGLS